MATIDWKHHQQDLEDVKAAQDQIKKDTEQYQTLKGSIESQHQKELAGARNPEEKQVADDKAGRLNAKADEDFRHTDRQNQANLQRMEDKLSANQNLTEVKPGQSPPGEAKPYEKHPDVGLPQYGAPGQGAANDNSPERSPPGGAPSPSGGGASGPGKSASEHEPERDFPSRPIPEMKKEEQKGQSPGKDHSEDESRSR